MKKNILFVVDNKKIGGVSALLEGILNNISLKKLNITLLILHDNGNALSNLSKDINVIYASSKFNVIDESLKDLLKKFKIVKAIKKIIIFFKIKNGSIKKYILKERSALDLYNFDIEIAFKAGFCSLFVAYGNSKSRINWVHENYKTYNMTKRYENTFKEVFKLFNKHIIVSSDAKEAFNEIYNEENKTIVIPNYIDEKKVKYLMNLPSNYEIDKSKINFVSLGRFSYEKGFDRLIYALKELKEKNRNLNLALYIIGVGDRTYLDKLIKRYNLSEYIKIILTSDINNNPYSFMKCCDFFILPSRSESFGMVRIEALICGLDIITTNEAIDENIFNISNSIIVGNSTEEIARGIQMALDKKCMFEEKTKFTYEKNNEVIIDTIQKLLEA